MSDLSAPHQPHPAPAADAWLPLPTAGALEADLVVAALKKAHAAGQREVYFNDVETTTDNGGPTLLQRLLRAGYIATVCRLNNGHAICVRLPQPLAPASPATTAAAADPWDALPAAGALESEAVIRVLRAAVAAGTPVVCFTDDGFHALHRRLANRGYAVTRASLNGKPHVIVELRHLAATNLSADELAQLVA